MKVHWELHLTWLNTLQNEKTGNHQGRPTCSNTPWNAHSRIFESNVELAVYVIYICSILILAWLYVSRCPQVTRHSQCAYTLHVYTDIFLYVHTSMHLHQCESILQIICMYCINILMLCSSSALHEQTLERSVYLTITWALIPRKHLAE